MEKAKPVRAKVGARDGLQIGRAKEKEAAKECTD
jgi:hypothetical protein